MNQRLKLFSPLHILSDIIHLVLSTSPETEVLNSRSIFSSISRYPPISPRPHTCHPFLPPSSHPLTPSSLLHTRTRSPISTIRQTPRIRKGAGAQVCRAGIIILVDDGVDENGLFMDGEGGVCGDCYPVVCCVQDELIVDGDQRMRG